jgi:inosine-uridine nucleoside N-ribohydrolase
LIPLYVDTDLTLGTARAEIDDGAALLILLGDPAFDVRGIGAVHGNAGVDSVIHNLRRMLSYRQALPIPLGRGSALPLVEDPAWFDDWKSGYGPTEPFPAAGDLPLAANLLIDAARAHPHALSVLAVGPLTNLALAARLAPDIIPLVREVVTMGGTFGADQSAEFNARCDPEAAAIVLNAGWPVRLFGLDITRRVHFSREEFAALSENDPAVALLKRQAPGWIDRIETMGWDRGGCALHDAVAASALIDETLFEYAEVEVTVELADRAKRGVTRLSKRPGSRIRAAVEVDVKRCHDLIWGRIGG